MKKKLIVLLSVLLIIAACVCAVLFVPNLKGKLLRKAEIMTGGFVKTALDHKEPELIASYDSHSGKILFLMTGDPDRDNNSSVSEIAKTVLYDLGFKKFAPVRKVVFEISASDVSEDPVSTKIAPSDLGRNCYAVLIDTADYEYAQGLYSCSVSYMSRGMDIPVNDASVDVKYVPEGLTVTAEDATVDAASFVLPDACLGAELQVWHEEDESDLQTIPFEIADDNTPVHVDIADHGYFTGDYHFRLYLNFPDDIRILGCETTGALRPENYVVATSDNAGGTAYTISVYDAGLDGTDASAVELHVYREDSPDSDPYVQAVDNVEGSNWTTHLSSSKLSGEGNFVVEIYGTVNGNSQKLGQETVTMHQVKLIALTFDDGPSKFTGEILDKLEEYDAHATFFVVGTCASNYPNALSRAVSLGCEVGNHTYDHAYLNKLDAAAIKDEVSRCSSIIASATGSSPAVMRPPGGNINDTVASNVGLPMILWSVDTRDWATRDTASTVECVKQEARDGSVILMHDLYEPTKNAALELIPWLAEQGYQMVTISELANARGYGLGAGQSYRSFY